MSELEPEIRRVLSLIAEEKAAKKAAERLAISRNMRQAHAEVGQVCTYLIFGLFCAFKTEQAFNYLCARFLKRKMEGYSFLVGGLGAIAGTTGLHFALSALKVWTRK